MLRFLAPYKMENPTADRGPGDEPENPHSIDQGWGCPEILFKAVMDRSSPKTAAKSCVKGRIGISDSFKTGYLWQNNSAHSTRIE